jgi:hypothetical protein
MSIWDRTPINESPFEKYFPLKERPIFVQLKESEESVISTLSIRISLNFPVSEREISVWLG